VLRKGATAEMESAIEEPNVNLVVNDTTVAQPAQGPRGVGEVVVVVLLDIGGACALLMGFVKFSMVNFASWSEIVFSFEPTPAILVRAMVFAAVMGILGGFFPAIRAARVSPIEAMRA
jgi:hypothetical protein